jgi:signal transduction histidine kinase/CheY-like chemotaxis protein
MQRDQQMPQIARSLAEIAHTLASAEESNERILRTLELLKTIVPNRSCVLLDNSSKSGHLLLAVPEPSRSEHQLLTSHLMQLLSLLTGDGEQSEPSSSPEIEKRAHLAVPVIGLNKTIGVLFVERPEDAYDEQDLRLVSVVSAQLGAYLTTLRLREEEVEHARRLGMALKRLEDTDRKKDEFLAMLGHELRNPLGAISTALQLLDDRSEHPQNPYHQVIDRQIKYLSHIVDDLLDASRVRLGKIVLKKQPTDLCSVASRWMEAFGKTSLVLSHDVRLELSSEPVTIDGDMVRLEQIFSNIVTNALKYTPPDGSVHIRVAKEGPSGIIRVTDNGIGMTREVLARIFDLFIQGDESLDRSQGGLGLGLPLVRSLVEMHGGTVEATSEGLGRGSEFLVRIPLAQDKARAQKETLDQPLDLPRGALRVLVVEDNDDARDMLQAMIESWGQQVFAAPDGLTGAQLAVTERPDVAVIDIGLPGLNGYELARRIRHELKSDKMTLLAMTGYGQPEDQRRAFEAGFDSHMVKPVRLDMLRAALAKVAQKKG